MTRPRPQLHLSTAVLTMLAAAALVWANTRSVQLNEEIAAVSMSTPGELIASRTFGHGWPFSAITTKHTLASVKTELIGEDQFETLALQPNPPEIHRPQAAANLSVALLILTPFALATEFLLRRNQTKSALTNAPADETQLPKNNSDTVM